jgi:hypothetical protein
LADPCGLSVKCFGLGSSPISVTSGVSFWTFTIWISGWKAIGANPIIDLWKLILGEITTSLKSVANLDSKQIPQGRDEKEYPPMGVREADDLYGKGEKRLTTDLIIDSFKNMISQCTGTMDC